MGHRPLLQNTMLQYELYRRQQYNSVAPAAIILHEERYNTDTVTAERVILARYTGINAKTVYLSIVLQTRRPHANAS